MLLQLIQCAYSIAQSPQGPTAEHLQLLYEGLQASWSNISFWHAGNHLATLSHNYPQAGEVLIEAAHHKKSSVRFNAVMALLAYPAQSVIDAVTKMCIADKSAMVRGKVADACLRIEDKTKVALLQRQLLVEENEKVIEELNFAIYWLQHDYEIKPGYHKNTFDLHVNSGTSYTGITISKEEIDTHSLEKIVQWVKENKWHSGPPSE